MAENQAALPGLIDFSIDSTPLDLPKALYSPSLGGLRSLTLASRGVSRFESAPHNLGPRRFIRLISCGDLSEA